MLPAGTRVGVQSQRLTACPTGVASAPALEANDGFLWVYVASGQPGDGTIGWVADGDLTPAEVAQMLRELVDEAPALVLVDL